MLHAAGSVCECCRPGSKVWFLLLPSAFFFVNLVVQYKRSTASLSHPCVYLERITLVHAVNKENCCCALNKSTTIIHIKIYTTDSVFGALWALEWGMFSWHQNPGKIRYNLCIHLVFYSLTNKFLQIFLRNNCHSKTLRYLCFSRGGWSPLQKMKMQHL